MKLKKILFITHDTNLTGAPLVLLYLLQWLRKTNATIKIAVLALEGGSLSRKFRNSSDEYFELSSFKQAEPTFSQIVKKKTLKKIRCYQLQQHPQDKFLQTLAKREFDLIYANTIVSIPVASKIKRLAKNSKLLVHIHELEMIIKLRLPGIKSYFEEVDKFIAVSQLTKSNLIDNYGVLDEKIAIVYDFAELRSSRPSIPEKKSFVVGGAGTQLWRKGGDIFIQTANFLVNHYPELIISFIWVGYLSEQEEISIKEDLKKMGLSEVVSFVGEQEHPENYFSQFDLFLMLSREDPFPLVSIEVAALKKPIICFEGATGTAEIVKEGGGFVVPYFDVAAVSEKIMYYYNNPRKLKEDGEIASKLFSEFVPEEKCPEIFSVIERTLS